LGIDYVHANELEIIDGKLTGNYLGKLLIKRKPNIYKPLQTRHIHINQTIAVGDGANTDVEFRSRNRFSCQTNRKEKAESSISSLGLDGVLYH
jgi:phosphoserine phosphatase